MPQIFPQWLVGNRISVPVEDSPTEPTINWQKLHGIYMSSSGVLRIALNRVLAFSIDGVGVVTAVGGIAAGGGFAYRAGMCHTGGKPAASAADGTDTTIGAVTEINSCIVAVPSNVLVTGVALLNGPTVGTDDLFIMIHDSAGAVIATTALAGVLSAGADVYQRIPLIAPVTLVGPASYHISLMVDGTTDNHHTHAFGDFPCGTHTGAVFGTPSAITPDTTFTAGDGPIASFYE